MSRSTQELSCQSDDAEDLQSQHDYVRTEADENLSAAFRVIQLQSSEIEKLRAELSALKQEVRPLEQTNANEEQDEYESLSTSTSTTTSSEDEDEDEDEDEAEVGIQDLGRALISLGRELNLKEREVLELEERNMMLTREIGFHQHVETSTRETETENQRLFQANIRSCDMIAQLQEENAQLSTALRQRTADTQAWLTLLNEAHLRCAITVKELSQTQMYRIDAFLAEGRPASEYRAIGAGARPLTGSRDRILSIEVPRTTGNTTGTYAETLRVLLSRT